MDLARNSSRHKRYPWTVNLTVEWRWPLGILNDRRSSLISAIRVGAANSELAQTASTTT
jgi:hypothetical protein